jgi:hypothetical protein
MRKSTRYSEATKALPVVFRATVYQKAYRDHWKTNIKPVDHDCNMMADCPDKEEKPNPNTKGPDNRTCFSCGDNDGCEYSTRTCFSCGKHDYFVGTVGLVLAPSWMSILYDLDE